MHRNPFASTIAFALLALLSIATNLPAQSLADPTVTEIIPLSFNTADLEYAPTVTADGMTLYFVSDRAGGMGGHDIWVSTRIGSAPADFSQPVNLGPPVNSGLNEGVASIAADGRTIFFTACQRPDGLGDCDIYLAELVGGKFTNIRNIVEINTPYWDTQPTVSADGRTLYFVSNRPGVMGGSGDADIWMSTRQSNGTWAVPRNAGPTVNTVMREDSPYLHPSGELLYFSSAGHGGIGGLDFNVSRRDGEGWSAPVNLGAPINTSRDERFIAVPASGDVIYFSSERTEPSNQGKLDIFIATGLVLPSGNPVAPSGEVTGVLRATPNPAADRVDVSLTGLEAAPGVQHELTVADVRGAVVARFAFSGDRTTVDLGELANGLYLLRVGGLATTVVLRR